jgi:hypothetical protein
MMASLRALLPALVLSSLLAACGGGSGTPTEVAGNGGGAAPSGCLPTQEEFDSLSMGAGYPAVKAVMGCEGQLLNDAVVDGISQKTYAWGSVASGPYLQASFRAGALNARLGQRLTGRTTPSSCTATAGGFAQLGTGIAYATAEGIVGCEGQMLNETVVDGVASRTYAWGDVAAGPYIQVEFREDALSTKLSQRLDGSGAASSCLPTRAGVDALSVGMGYASAAAAMGCDGQLLNDVTAGGTHQVTYAWGNVVSGPYAQVQFVNGQLSTTLSQRLDGSGSASGCTATQAKFDAMSSGIGYAAAKGIVGCEGQLLNDVTVGGVHQKTYAWGDVGSGPYIQAKFVDDQLSSRLAQRLDGTGAPSSCVAGSTSFNGLATGMDYASAAALVGCGGQLLNEVVTGGTDQKTYAWGDVASGPYIQVSFSNGLLSSKIGMRL